MGTIWHKSICLYASESKKTAKNIEKERALYFDKRSKTLKAFWDKEFNISNNITILRSMISF